jgi:demethylmenaquinone methyltransferase/2-methoxy-6-polyprenyl-1,4-benzoquinol methylase
MGGNEGADRDGIGERGSDRDEGDALPVPVSNRAVRATYDRWASLYANTVARLEAPSKRRAIELLDPAPGSRVLDLGCGPGLTLPDLAERVGKCGSVYALDAAPGMLAESAARVRSSAGIDRVSILRSDARQLPLGAGSVDAVVAFDVLELFDRPSLRVVLREIRRVLAPDGRLCAVTMDRADTNRSRFLRGYEWAYRHVPGFARVGCRPFDVRAVVTDGDFRVERLERSRRGGIWPVVTAYCRPDRESR